MSDEEGSDFEEFERAHRDARWAHFLAGGSQRRRSAGRAPFRVTAEVLEGLFAEIDEYLREQDERNGIDHEEGGLY